VARDIDPVEARKKIELVRGRETRQIDGSDRGAACIAQQRHQKR
jgi:hypothetical protein